jgi:deoxyadenosine/deoxycytidine kinase
MTSDTTQKYVIVSGNIAAGKTTMVKSVCGRQGWDPIVEPDEENPLLAMFYADKGKWSYPTQIYLLADSFAEVAPWCRIAGPQRTLCSPSRSTTPDS